jgi:hypothetical protein
MEYLEGLKALTRDCIEFNLNILLVISLVLLGNSLFALGQILLLGVPELVEIRQEPRYQVDICTQCILNLDGKTAL